MNNPPSPYPHANQPGQTQGYEMAYSYPDPDAAGSPQQSYPPTQPIFVQGQVGYPDLQSPDYADYAEAQQAGSLSGRKSRNGLWMALTALGLLLLLAGGGFYYYYLLERSTPEKTLQAYCSAIKSDDGNALYNTYSSEAQAQTDAAHLQQGLRLIELLSGGIEDCSVDVGSIHEDNNQARGRVTFILSSGRMSSATLHLIDENGQWRVENDAIFP